MYGVRARTPPLPFAYSSEEHDQINEENNKENQSLTHKVKQMIDGVKECFFSWSRGPVEVKRDHYWDIP